MSGAEAKGIKTMLRFVTLSNLSALPLLALAFAQPAGAEISVVPGSVVGKAHQTIPMVEVPANFPVSRRRVDKPTIVLLPAASQAGAHPDATGAGDLDISSAAFAKDFFIDSPPGFLGSATTVPVCSREDFQAFVCSPASQVGVTTVSVEAFGSPQTSPVYQITPAPGFPASFGFRLPAGTKVVLNANVRTDQDYGLEVGATNISTFGGALESATVTLWGVPADPVHDEDRWDPTKQATDINGDPIFDSEGNPDLGNWGASSGLPIVPFISLPTDCSNDSLVSLARIRSWSEPERWVPEHPLDPTYAIPAPQPTGCEKLSFKPSITIVPSATNSDSPTGVSVQMDIPQNNDPNGLSTPHLRRAVVTMPEGMSVNPSAADGIQGCTSKQIGLLTVHGNYPNPIRFARGDANCPQASKIGNAIAETALLEDPVPGDVYLASPVDNPFGSELALYLVLRGPGFVVKAPGRVEADESTGRLTASFDYSPQLPFDELDVNFFGGPRAPLATSPVCGEQAIATELTPWSHPDSGPLAEPQNKYLADRGPAGSPCSFALAARPFGPDLSSGTENPIAGGHSNLTMRLTRSDGHQPLAGLIVRPPLGFTATLRNIPYCSEQALEHAATRAGAWTIAHPDCPAASRVGRSLVGAGAGPTPLFTAGSAYLAGPYKGAPLSLAIVTPALAGGTPADPVFDLGTVVVRVALHVSSHDAQITAMADPVPQTLKVPRPGGGFDGFPLRIKDIRIVMDRPEWGINPTSCAEKSFQVEATGQNGATASLSNRFQAVECASLGFKPRLSLRLRGSTKRTGNPSLRAVLRPRPGDANISRAAVTLPRTAFLDNEHIRTVCTRIQFAADNCPAAAIYGRARAFTPLLDQPLEGPVYLRSSDNLLPDLVADLRGPDRQPIRIELVGRVDSINGGLRNTFQTTPDAPVEKFVLTMQGGKKGLIVNSDDLCGQTSRATVSLRAHNGRRHGFRPEVVAVGCQKQGKRAARRGR
jgi:hypothetical protein